MDTNTNTQITEYGVSKYKNIMGITCYMNSILHILQQTPIFMEYISQARFRDDIIEKTKSKDIKEIDEKIKKLVIVELCRLFSSSLSKNDYTITPTKFKAIIGTKDDIWNEYNHQDSQEFFNFLISNLQEEVGQKHIFIPGLNYKEDILKLSIDISLQLISAVRSSLYYNLSEYSLLKVLFNGMTETIKRCSCCNNTTHGFEPFLTWGLPIPVKKEKIHLYNCIDEFIKEEQLDSDNKMNCEMCGLKNKGYNQTLLWKTPKILVIHIKRFMVNLTFTQKITDNIIYPIMDLDLSKYFNPVSPYKEQSKYDLIGINIHKAFGHSGNTNAGHYTSMVKNIINNNWHYYNDSNDVKHIVSKDQLQNSNAYMLFYYRHN
jgi:ubiquitin carboxyl-terminal hydrolase 8